MCSGLTKGAPSILPLASIVADDFAGLLRRVAKLHQGGRHSIVDDFDDAAADELLILDESEVGFDAGGIAIHHETDGAGGSENGDLRVLENRAFRRERERKSQEVCAPM